MAQLHNRISRKELKERIARDITPRYTISFYSYTHIADPQQFRDNFYLQLTKIGVLGRIYIAHEGINAQLSVPVSQFQLFRDLVYGTAGLDGIRFNLAVENANHSFFVLDVKVRRKIVADGIEDPTFDMHKKGKYVNAKHFNVLAKDPETLIIDMRNHYEYEVGHFKHALPVPSDTFREQLPMAVDMLKDKKDRNIIMYCTGGIRCEKASAYLLHEGFNNVYHLEGGIINYCKQVREQGLENHFIGKNFVFDERMGERISDDVIAQCHQCGKPCDQHVNCANTMCHLLFIQCETCAQTYEGCCSEDCKVVKCNPAAHLSTQENKDTENNSQFNKSRRRYFKLTDRTPK